MHSRLNLLFRVFHFKSHVRSLCHGTRRCGHNAPTTRRYSRDVDVDVDAASSLASLYRGMYGWVIKPDTESERVS